MFENKSQEFEEHLRPFNNYTPKVSNVCHLLMAACGVSWQIKTYVYEILFFYILYHAVCSVNNAGELGKTVCP